MSIKNWKVEKKIDNGISAKYPGVDPVILQLLINRGLKSKEDMDSFFDPKYEDLHDPFLFRDMAKLVDRIKQARLAKEKVFVYGDYDADGVCSCVILVEALRSAGVENVDVYIPHREMEGYGLNKDAIDYIAGCGANLLVTVDCGTSNVGEIAYAKDKGLDVIILDHHEEPLNLPKDVVAFLNPHLEGETYPFKRLSAAGVAFKVAQALWKSFELRDGREKWFLDLAAIATVADMMELFGENRAIVKYGLIVLNKTKRLGLKALVSAMDMSGSRLGVYEIGFMIGPRLNAAGRIEHANSAYELLESADPALTDELARALNATNTTRQGQTDRILKEALAQVEPRAEFDKVLIAVGDNWQVGVVGLVSSKITERFNRPSLVMARTEKGLVGSGRSIDGFNITEALSKSSQYLKKFGGHEGACGFTLKSEDALSGFRASLNKIADEILSGEDLIKTISIDMELRFDEITHDLALKIEKLSPFGIGNPTPKFASFGARVESVSLVGKDNKHLKLRLGQSGASLGAIAFGFGEKWRCALNIGDLVDIVYEVIVDEFNGRKDAQLKVVDIKNK